MYGAVLGVFIVLSAVGIWRLLKRTKLGLLARILLAALLTAFVTVVLVWGSVCASILLYQLSDPISW